jgi:hypothetical protein
MVQVVLHHSRVVKFERFCNSNQDQMESQVRYVKTRSVRDSTATDERPQRGYSLPIQSCDVELTEVQIMSQVGTWWTLGFEAFGDIDAAPANLTLVLLPDKPLLARNIGTGALMSYPAWLVTRPSA